MPGNHQVAEAEGRNAPCPTSLQFALEPLTSLHHAAGEVQVGTPRIKQDLLAEMVKCVCVCVLAKTWEPNVADSLNSRISLSYLNMPTTQVALCWLVPVAQSSHVVAFG